MPRNGRITGNVLAEWPDRVAPSTPTAGQPNTILDFDYTTAMGVWNMRSTTQFPKAPLDPYFDNVTLLLHGDGVDNGTTFIDSSSENRTITPVGDVRTVTSVSKFGTASIFFDGSGDYLTTPTAANLNFGTGDFTLEFWINFDGALGSSFPRVLTKGEYQLAADTWGILMTRSTGGITFNTGNPDVGLTIGTLTTGVWTHIAVTRSGSDLSSFFNGVKISTITNTVNYASTYPVNVGAGSSGANFFGGYIDELRITTGIARYTADFPVPTAPYPDQ